MQCFQKDPNLRVSARKLLKHPWIVNARRSDSVVPKKPTEYEEAVKSVQQWNEALKSPNPGSLRKASRPTSSSPVPGRREPPTPLVTPGKGPLSLAKPRAIAEQFRSPNSTAEDNWDNDFDSAPSPSALQRPRLRPQDNFGGLLSSEKLKAYASFETVTEESNWDDNFEGDLTMRSPLQIANSDPLQTIRAHNHRRAGTNETRPAAPTNLPETKTLQATHPRAETALNPRPKQTIPAGTAPVCTASLYTEDSEEDYSDLVAANEGAFESSLLVSKVGWEKLRNQ